MARFTKKQRQQIVEDFCARHGQRYDPNLFVEEVRQTGPEHPAYDWFTWDDSEAAGRWRRQEARQFVSDLRITWSVEEVGHDRSIQVTHYQVPAAISPPEQRDDAAHNLFGLDKPTSWEDYRATGLRELRGWLNRYRAALIYFGGSPAAIEAQIELLEAARASAGGVGGQEVAVPLAAAPPN